MTIVIQNMGDITLFWVINVLVQNGVIKKSNRSSSSCTAKGDKLVLSGKPEAMEKKDPMAFNKLGYSNNLTKLSMQKKENLLVQILASKFHTKSADEPGAGEEIRLNLIMKYLIINGYANGSYMKARESKRSK